MIMVENKASTLIYIPYSGKLSRDKTFANFADLKPFVKVFSANLSVHVRVRMRPILPLTHESFLREIFYFHIFAKVLSLESFPLYGISNADMITEQGCLIVTMYVHVHVPWCLWSSCGS